MLTCLDACHAYVAISSSARLQENATRIVISRPLSEVYPNTRFEVGPGDLAGGAFRARPAWLSTDSRHTSMQPGCLPGRRQQRHRQGLSGALPKCHPCMRVQALWSQSGQDGEASWPSSEAPVDSKLGPCGIQARVVQGLCHPESERVILHQLTAPLPAPFAQGKAPVPRHRRHLAGNGVGTG